MRSLTLAGRLVGRGHPPYVVAELSCNHNGDRQRALDLVRTGGLILVDNVLWHGAVADPSRDDEDTEAIREFNRALADDPRISLSLVPIGDGLTMARKR